MENEIGIEKWSNNSYYKGQYDNGKKNGLGIYKWENGNYYFGEWKNNFLFGFGIYKMKNKKYQGQFFMNYISGYGEMIYMEPSNNQMMSPVTEGRQTLRQSPGENVSRSIVSTVKMNLRERPDTAQLVGEKPIQSLVVAIPSRGIGEERLERSPKTINIGDSKEQTEYNIRTLNARKSPKGGLYQNYNNNF